MRLKAPDPQYGLKLRLKNRRPRRRTHGRRPDPAGGKITAGVPLVQLIKRSLVDVPELVTSANWLALERFRRLKTLLSRDETSENRVIVVTGVAPADGASLVAMNLALAFLTDDVGEVLVVDANLRRPVNERAKRRYGRIDSAKTRRDLRGKRPS